MLILDVPATLYAYKTINLFLDENALARSCPDLLPITVRDYSRDGVTVRDILTKVYQLLHTPFLKGSETRRISNYLGEQIRFRGIVLVHNLSGTYKVTFMK